MWASTALLGAAGMVAAYLRHHHLGGWNAVLSVLGGGMAQLVFVMIWYHLGRATAEPVARRPSPHPRGPADR